MSIRQYNSKELLLLGVTILISRIPFLFSGYGSEEDAWGLMVTARNILDTGTYEVSRLPGHPVQEILITILQFLPAWSLNLLTAVMSAAGAIQLVRFLQHFNISGSLLAGIAFAATPVVYINSTNVMDYIWAISLVLISMNQVLHKNFIAGGIILGIATGFRITSLAMLLPALILIEPAERYGRPGLKFIFSSLLISFISYLPPLITYGPGFFTFYKHFPYPEMSKIVYKATFGAFGVTGTFAVTASLVILLAKFGKWDLYIRSGRQRLLMFCMVSVILYLIAYLRVPQKSAFFIPIIPWLIVLFWNFLNKGQKKWFALIMVFSSFSFGLNLDHPLRGSDKSNLAFPFNAGTTSISLDPLYGPVAADISKRNNKISFAKHVNDRLRSLSEDAVLIAGWYQNEILFLNEGKDKHSVDVRYYLSEKELISLVSSGKVIHFLPEQDVYNDLRHKGSFTTKYARLLDF